MSVVASEVAILEIEKWLDHKKITARKREDLADTINLLSDAVSDGILVLDEKFNLIQTLSEPVGTEKITSKLTFKPRLQVGAVYQHLQGIKGTDVEGRIFAYAAALTENPKELIKKIDTGDFNIVQAIVVFFL